VQRRDQEAALSIRGLYKVFADDGAGLELALQGRAKDEIQEETGAVVGLRDINIDIRRGELFVVMGLSGCGKSTLVRCINRLIEPSLGEVWLGGREVTAMGEDELREVRRRPPHPEGGRRRLRLPARHDGPCSLAGGAIRRRPAGTGAVIAPPSDNLSGPRNQVVPLSVSVGRRPRTPDFPSTPCMLYIFHPSVGRTTREEDCEGALWRHTRKPQPSASPSP